MNIVFVHPTTNIYAGSTKALINIIKGIGRNSDCKCLIIVPNRNGIYSFLKSEGYNVIDISHYYSIYPTIHNITDIILFLPRLFNRLFVNFVAILKILKILKKDKYDIIHTNASVIAIGYYAAKLSHIPHVWHLREYGAQSFNQFYYYFSKRQFWRKLKSKNSYTICITKGIQKHFNLENHPNSTVIYDGVFHTNSEAFIEQKSKYFFFAGRLEKYKGIEDLLQAYSTFIKHNDGNREYRLKIAGEAISESYKIKLLQMVKDLQINEFVDFIGFQTDVSLLEQHAYCVVVPSHSEGFGFVTAESMMNGALVIGNNNTGTKEQFDNGLTFTNKEIGLRYNSVEELAICLIQIVESGIENYTNYIKRGQQTAAKLYTIENNVNSIYHYYKKILSR